MRTILLFSLLLLLPAMTLAQSTRCAPPIALKDLNGRTVRLADFKGRVVLLNFWATWCPPCQAEIPDLVKWQNEYGSRGLQVIGMTYPPTNVRTVRSFVRQLSVNYPVLLGDKATKAVFDSGETLPFSVVIDREGNVRETIEGIILPEEFEQKIRTLLEPAKP